MANEPTDHRKACDNIAWVADRRGVRNKPRTT
jgi:hypothetical protein